MQLFSKRSLLPALFLLIVGGVLGAQLHSSISADDAVEQFKKMRQAFVIISGKYVEPVDSKGLAEGGVEGMLEQLDPHSSYVPPEQAKRTRQSYEGSFGGIGIEFDVLDDTARVVSPLAGGPSKKAGLISGDRIVQIEDSTAVGLSMTDIREKLTGEIGTDVTFTVYRPLSDSRHTFTITRDEIPLYSVQSSYMIDDRTGYIRIGRFAKSTTKEFLQKVDTLKSEGMERLVVDLRQNPGGVMQSAVEIADEMLGTAGQTIVETRGRSDNINQTFRAQEGGRLAHEPITVLVDGNSASASEILAGALQDHDRGLLVGRRTFGKALVQKPYRLNDGSFIQLTVGRYYTPVGRLIQTPYERGDMRNYYEEKFANRRDAVYNVQKYRDSIPDSLTYETDHGRTVFGGGGILPDYVVAPDTTSLSGFLKQSQVDQLFAVSARQWFSSHDQNLQRTWRNRKDEFLRSYEVPDEAVSVFWNFVQEEEILTLTDDSEAVDPTEQIYPAADTAEVGDLVRLHLKGYVANTLYGQGAGQPVLNEVDPAVQRAMSLWPSSQDLAAYYAPSETGE
jgi:carboxyl-terminal processing protease